MELKKFSNFINESFLDLSYDDKVSTIKDLFLVIEDNSTNFKLNFDFTKLNKQQAKFLIMFAPTKWRLSINNDQLNAFHFALGMNCEFTTDLDVKEIEKTLLSIFDFLKYKGLYVAFFNFNRNGSLTSYRFTITAFENSDNNIFKESVDEICELNREALKETIRENASSLI
jgi:hypothetical protein